METDSNHCSIFAGSGKPGVEICYNARDETEKASPVRCNRITHKLSRDDEKFNTFSSYTYSEE